MPASPSPKDFTPVCTSEIGALAKRAREFEQRGVKLVGLSCDSVRTRMPLLALGGAIPARIAR